MSEINGFVNDLSKITHKGEIQIIFGPMFSGKSAELIRRVRLYNVVHDL